MAQGHRIPVLEIPLPLRRQASRHEPGQLQRPATVCRSPGRQGTAREGSSLLRSMEQFSAFVAPSTCMGPPLTESPECCQVIERKWHAAEPHKGASTTVCRAIHDGMASARRNDGDRCIGIGCRHDISSDCDALQERPAKSAGRSQISALRMDFHKATTSRVMAGPIRGWTSGAGNDCDPFRSARSWPSGRPTRVSVDTGRGSASTRLRRNGRGSRVLAGGIASAFDAAPF